MVKFNIKMRQTMKKLFILMASAVFVFAASCNKFEDGSASVEKELITVQLNPATKTSLSGAVTVWSEGDAVSVTVGGQNIGTLTLKSGSTFSGEIEAGHTGKAVLNYPAGVTSVPTEQTAVENSFADKTALLEGETTVEALRAGEGATLLNKTALLEFTVAQNGDVTFEVGTSKYTVTGCETGKTYYACVEPATEVSFTARIGGYLSKNASANKTFTANNIAPLGELPAPVKSAWGLIGTMTNWSDDVPMYKEGDYEVVKGVEIKSTDQFKFRKDAKWDTSIAGGIVAPNTERKAGWVDMTISEEGVYDIYVDARTTPYKYYIMTPGKTPADATQPGPITITVIFDGDTNRDYLHMWSDGGEIANNMACTSKNPFKWEVTVPAGDQQNRDYRVILKKGNGWGSYQTADSEKMCLRNPMPLKVASNKATHK